MEIGTEYDDLIRRLTEAFPEGPPPSLPELFWDPFELEYHKNWIPPRCYELSEDNSGDYIEMSAKGKFYYMPGLIKLLFEGKSVTAHDQLLYDLSEPDYPTSDEWCGLWQTLLDLPKEQYCALCNLLPTIEKLIGSGSTTTDIHFARRRARYWTGEGCEETQD